MPISITPTIFIGLGGSGCKTVTQLKKRMQNSPHEKFGFAWYLKIDSRVSLDQGVENDNDDYLSLVTRRITGTALVNLFSNVDMQKNNRPIHDFFTSWYPKNSRGEYITYPVSFEEGAGAIRHCGRLLLAHHSQESSGGRMDLKSLLLRVHDEYTVALGKDNHELDRQKLQELHVVIFAGAGGGTGSSLLNDIAYLIRGLIDPFKIIGVVFLDDIVADKEPSISTIKSAMMRKNTVRCLAEIDFWEQFGTKQIASYNAYWNSIPDPKTGNAETKSDSIPFDLVVLMDTQNGAGCELAHSGDYYGFAADYFSLFYGSQQSNVIFSGFINDVCGTITQIQEGKYDLFQSPRYARIGMTTLSFPLKNIEDYIRSSVLYELLEQGFMHRHTQGQDKPVRGVVEDRFLTLKNKFSLSDLKNLNLLRDAKHNKDITNPLCADNESLLLVKNYSTFQNEFKSIISRLDSYYRSLDYKNKGTQWLNSFQAEVEQILQGFAGLDDVPGNTSVKNMSAFLTELTNDLHAIIAQLEVDQNNESRKLKQIEEKIKSCEQEWNASFKWRQWTAKAKGASAKAEVELYIREYSSRRFALKQVEARLAVLKVVLDNIEIRRGNIEFLVEEITKIQRTLQIIRDTAFSAIRPFDVLNYNVLTKQEELLDFMPAWGDFRAIKQTVKPLYRTLISGQFSDEIIALAEKENRPVLGFLDYLNRFSKDSKKNEKICSEYRKNTEWFINTLFEKQTTFLQELNSLSIWDYIVSRAEKDITGVKPEEKTNAFKNALSARLLGYRDKAKPFGKVAEGVIQLTQQPIEVHFIEYNKSDALKSIKKNAPDVTGDTLLNIMGMAGHIKLKEIDPNLQDKGKIIIKSFAYMYPLHVFERMTAIRDCFEHPEADAESWLDRRYVGWMQERLRHMNTNADNAFCGLAFVWRDGKHQPSSGLKWLRDTKTSLDYFEFLGVVNQAGNQDLSWLFEDLKKDARAWKTLVSNLKTIWNAISPDQRVAVLKEAQKVLLSEAKRRQRPDWKKYLKEASDVVADMAADPSLVRFEV